MSGWRELILIILLFLAAWVLHRYSIRSIVLKIIKYPLMLVVVLLHECGHALAAILTGGQAKQIRVFLNGNGITLTQGGIRLIILNAGYLGSIFFGILIFCLPYTRLAEYTLIILGVLLLAITGFWVRDVFTLVFATGIGCLLLFVSQLVSPQVEVILAKFIGVCCILYAWLDMNRYIDNINQAQVLLTDAQALAKLTKIPAFVWGFCWRVISLVALMLLFALTLEAKVL